MGRLRVAACALTALFALTAASCGGGDESASVSSAEEWAADFCTAITDWTDSLGEARDRFADPSSLSAEGLEAVATDVRTATRQLVDDLRALGAPDTESGQAAKDALDELATTLESKLSEIEDATQGATSLTELPGALSAITEALSEMATAFGSTLETIGTADTKGELQTAFEQAPACSEIVGSSGG